MKLSRLIYLLGFVGFGGVNILLNQKGAPQMLRGDVEELSVNKYEVIDHQNTRSFKNDKFNKVIDDHIKETRKRAILKQMKDQKAKDERETKNRWREEELLKKLVKEQAIAESRAREQVRDKIYQTYLEDNRRKQKSFAAWEDQIQSQDNKLLDQIYKTFAKNEVNDYFSNMKAEEKSYKESFQSYVDPVQEVPTIIPHTFSLFDIPVELRFPQEKVEITFAEKTTPTLNVVEDTFDFGELDIPLLKTREKLYQAKELFKSEVLQKQTLDEKKEALDKVKEISKSMMKLSVTEKKMLTNDEVFKFNQLKFETRFTPEQIVAVGGNFANRMLNVQVLDIDWDSVFGIKSVDKDRNNMTEQWKTEKKLMEMLLYFLGFYNNMHGTLSEGESCFMKQIDGVVKHEYLQAILNGNAFTADEVEEGQTATEENVDKKVDKYYKYDSTSALLQGLFGEEQVDKKDIGSAIKVMLQDALNAAVFDDNKHHLDNGFLAGVLRALDTNDFFLSNRFMDALTNGVINGKNKTCQWASIARSGVSNVIFYDTSNAKIAEKPDFSTLWN